MQLHELLCPDYFPDWEDEDECKWYVYYDNKNKCFVCTLLCVHNRFIVYFTAEAAKKACEILNRADAVAIVSHVSEETAERLADYILNK